MSAHRRPWWYVENPFPWPLIVFGIAIIAAVAGFIWACW